LRFVEHRFDEIDRCGGAGVDVKGYEPVSPPQRFDTGSVRQRRNGLEQRPAHLATAGPKLDLLLHLGRLFPTPVGGRGASARRPPTRRSTHLANGSSSPLWNVFQWFLIWSVMRNGSSSPGSVTWYFR